MTPNTSAHRGDERELISKFHMGAKLKYDFNFSECIPERMVQAEGEAVDLRTDFLFSSSSFAFFASGCLRLMPPTELFTVGLESDVVVVIISP